MASITCKLSYGDETRRFTVQTDTITYTDIHQRAEALFDFDATTKFKLQYKDDEGDVITMSTDAEMREAVGLAAASTPPILRVSVKMDGGSRPAAAPPAPAPAAAAGEAGAAPAPPVDLAGLFKNIQETLPKVLESSTPPGAPPDLGALFKNIGERLPQFVESLPECVRAQMHNAELDLAATLASNTPADLASAFGAKGPGVSFSVLPNAPGYGDRGVHPGVTCDKSGMSPIVGPRYNLKGFNYDLCEAEFAKLDPAEQAKFVKIDAPFGAAPQNNGGVHHGVTCDKSGMSPIVGPRYNLPGHNYDLCEAEFAKIDPAEQAKFVKIDAPSWSRQWRPKCWGRMGGHPCHNKGHGGEGGHGRCEGARLAARFVSDVSIFDGTQMAPGTRFTKIWRIKNVGEVPWPPGTKMLFVGGDRMTAEMTVPVGPDPFKAVMPGEEVDVAIDMIAPTELGRYLGYWRLVGPLGRRRFGQRVWCHIQVVDPAASLAPHDPNVIANELSHLMAKARKDDPDGEDGETENENDQMAPAAAAAAVSAAAAAAAVSAAASASASSSSSASALSSVVSSATSSAVSVRKDELPAAEEGKPAAELPEVEKVEKPPAAAQAEKPEAAAPEDKPADAPIKDEEVKDERDVATQLMTMGFEPKSVELVMEKNAGVYPLANLLETCSRDLVQLSEWDSMFSDLEEMGFEDREKNTRLMIKHGGSVKRIVKDLVADTI